MIIGKGNDAPIGIYDSGLGGLTVWQAVRAHLPQERVVYYGDTAHVPYGGRPKSDILSFSQEIIGFLLQQGVKLVIAACNTSSALALPELAGKVAVPLVGMIEPSVHEAVRVTKNGRIGLMATEGTVRSGAHARLLARLRPEFSLVSQACPSLVPLIEAGRTGAEMDAAVAACVQPLLAAEVDCIILGCTHYPLISAVIQAAVDTVRLIDPAEAVVEAASAWLTKEAALSTVRAGADRVFVSGAPETFARSAVALGFDLRAPVRHVQTEFAGARHSD